MKKRIKMGEGKLKKVHETLEMAVSGDGGEVSQFSQRSLPATG